MRKLIMLLLSAVMLMGIGASEANAQIVVKKHSEKAEKLVTLAQMWTWIYKDNLNYYLVMKSTSQVDPYDYIVQIGTNKKECLESLQALVDMCDTIGKDRMEIKDKDGQILYVTGTKVMGIPALSIVDADDSHIANTIINKNTLKKGIKWIEKNM